MGIFSIFSKSKKSTAIYEFKDGDRLYDHISLSQEQYEQCYLESLRRFSVDHPTDDALRLAEFSLRARRAYIIPAGIAPEDDYMTRDKWTYVCFIMSLAHSIGYINGQDQARLWMVKVVPEFILKWLGKDVGLTMIKTIQGDYSDSYQLKLIIDYSVKVTGLSITDVPTEKTKIPNDANNSNGFVSQTPEIESPSKQTKVKTHTVRSNSDNDHEEQLEIDFPDEIIRPDLNTASSVGYGPNASMMIKQIEQDIFNKRIKVNFATASVHVVEGGVVVYKKYLEEYCIKLDKPMSLKKFIGRLLDDGVCYHRYKLVYSKVTKTVDAYYFETTVPDELELTYSVGLLREFPSLD